MKPEKLINIKKELLNYSVIELTDICVRLAKYKKENKELLQYLLFDANDPLEYADQIKVLLLEDFISMQKHYYYSAKSLRKIIRLINRYAKYTASKQVEIELALWFCNNYLVYADLRSSHKPLQSLLLRQFEKINKLLPKLHEDLQFDYRQEFETLLLKADQQTWWFNRNTYM